MIINTKYGEYDVDVVWGTYPSGRKAMKLFDSKNGMPILIATVDLPVHLEEDEILIKNWSENEGVLEELQRLGLIGEVLEEVPTGFVKAHKVKLLV